jgi:1,4-alpha-glucan branching enzyme
MSFLGITQLDSYLDPFKPALRSRYSKAQQWLKTINDTEGGMESFTRASTQLYILRNISD